MNLFLLTKLSNCVCACAYSNLAPQEAFPVKAVSFLKVSCEGHQIGSLVTGVNVRKPELGYILEYNVRTHILLNKNERFLETGIERNTNHTCHIQLILLH